ncbi:MAG: hypothetical protein WBM75_14950 [Polyangiales bacterium]|jgi:hypothetical protein
MRQLLANLCVFGLIAGFSALSVLDPDVYYQHVQEDQPLEWATFWGFMVAAVLFVRAAILQREKRQLPWFFAGLATFCVLVAMEEISWGQRVLGYTPPLYFLENNYQLELNLHNVIATSLRKQLLGAILVVYGLLLPLLKRIPTGNKLLTKLQITAPPGGLASIFAVLLGLLIFYPLPYTGELIEACMALAFLFAAIAASDHIGDDSDEPSEVTAPIRWPALVGTLSLVAILAFGSALWSRAQLSAEPVVVEVAATEIRAIERDLRKLIDDESLACGKHERLNAMAKRSKGERLRKGRFRSLTRSGLPEERAEFFIDPWSTAYWVRTSCNDRRDKVFLYSFGPNRGRDSSKWKLGGDDIGVIFRVRKDEALRAENER